MYYKYICLRSLYGGKNTVTQVRHEVIELSSNSAPELMTSQHFISVKNVNVPWENNAVLLEVVYLCVWLGVCVCVCVCPCVVIQDDKSKLLYTWLLYFSCSIMFKNFFNFNKIKTAFLSLLCPFPSLPIFLLSSFLLLVFPSLSFLLKNQ